MKHIKSYKLFEADIKRTFDEWLQDPKAPSQEFIYQFEFPVKKSYRVNESRLDVEDLIHFFKYEQGFDICNEIANEIELEYTTNLDEDEDEDLDVSVSKEEVHSNFSQYFDQWIEQKFEGDIEKFFRMYNLEYETIDLNEKDFIKIKDDFNKNDLKRYYTYKEYNHDFKIEKLEITELQGKNTITGVIKTDRKLQQDEIDSIKDYIEGQCSDGWGEGFEQNIEKEKINKIPFLIVLKPWWGDGYPQWSLEIKEI